MIFVSTFNGGHIAKNISKSSSLEKRSDVLFSLSMRGGEKRKEVQYGKSKKKLIWTENFRGYLSNNLSSCFISCDVSLLTIITYFWAIQRGLQYFYGPFL